MKGTCLLSSVLLLIMKLSTCDSSFLREKAEVQVLGNHHLVSEEHLRTSFMGVRCLLFAS